MFGLDPDELRNIKEVFAKVITINKVVIYGSRAKGNYRNGSDIDITVFGENLTLDNSLYPLTDLLDGLYLPYQFDISIFVKIDNENLKNHIKRVGKILYMKQKELPEGWEIKKLGEVCDIINGSTPLRTNKDYWENGNFPWFTIDDIREQGIIITETKQKVTEKALKKLRILPVDTILLCCTASIGVFAITKIELTTNQQFNGLVIKNKKELNPMFLLYFSSTLKDVLSNLSGKATIDFIPISRLKDIKIPLPPLPEQQRIVAILDEAFAAIAIAKTNAQQNLKNAKELFESYLQGVFENGNWKTKTIQEVTKVINGYAFASKDFKSTNTIKSIKITNVGVKEFVAEADNYLPEKFKDTLKAVQVKEGNIVIALTRTIISAGLKVAVVPKSYDGALVNQRVAALVPNEKIINQRYLYNFLTTDGVAKYVLAHVNTLMQPNLSINDLKNLAVPCPSLKTQQTIVKKLDALNAETKKLEAIYQQKITNLEELKKSILQKAFAGELIVGATLTVAQNTPEQ
jgi:type I restriction enzyme S subunit